MLPFQHNFPPVRVSFGLKSLQNLPNEMARANVQRAIVFTGKSLARHPLGLRRLEQILNNKLISVFDAVESHSPLPSIEKAVQELSLSNADCVVALGGGSSVVSARAAAILAAEQRPIVELCSRVEPGKPPVSPKLQAAKIPIFSVPTTPTTGCIKAGTAVLDPSSGRRMTMYDPKTRAAAIFVDPALLSTTPDPILMDASLHSLSMAVQGLESSRQQVFAEAALLHGFRIIIENLPAIGTASETNDTRSNLVLAALLIGEATDHTGGGLASVLGHCVGSRVHVGNGLINALLLPHTVEFNLRSTHARLERLSSLMHMENPSGLPEKLRRFFASLHLPSRLRDLNVRNDIFEQVARDAFGDWFLQQNPREVTSESEIVAILRRAY